MKTRIRKTINNTYRVEYKGWIFWKYYGEEVSGFEGGTYTNPYTYETEEEAVIGLVEMVKKKEDLQSRIDASGTVFEIDSKDIKEKLGEYFV